VNEDRIDLLLRRAADDVNAACQSATPPPIDHLAGRRSRSTALVPLVCVVLLVMAGIGLVQRRDRDDLIAPAVTPIAEVTTPAAREPHPCQLVIGIAHVLEDPPAAISDWVDLGAPIDELEALIAAENTSDSSARRYTRFAALARQAADLGAAGGFTPAQLQASDALAVAEDLIEFEAMPDCQFRRSDPESPGG
jgi:hypothetical protein